MSANEDRRSGAKDRPKDARPKEVRIGSAAKDEGGGLGKLLHTMFIVNFWLKLIAVLCALSLYAFIHSAQNTQRTVAVKLVAQSPPEAKKRELLTDLPGTVDVTLIGPRQQLETFSPDDHSITLDLSAAKSTKLRLVADMIAGLPPRVRIDRLYPAELDIRFDDIRSRAIPVVITPKGVPANGMEVKGELKVEPRDITVVGIATEVDTLQSIAADPFEISGLGEGTHTRKLRLAVPPSHVSYNSQVVSVEVTIGKRLAQRSFKKVPVVVIGVGGAKVFPKVVQVKISGLPSDVDTLDGSSIIARARVPVADGAEPPKSNSIEVELEVVIAGVQVEVIPAKAVVSW